MQYLLDCDDTNYACDGGWMTDAYFWTIDHGIVEWNDYAREYKRTSYKCKEPGNVARFYNKGA